MNPTPRSLVDPQLLKLVRCPRTGAELRLADSAEVQRVNEAISQGRCRDAMNEPVLELVEGGLVTAGGDCFYGVRDKIPALIPGEAILLTGEPPAA